MQRTTVSRVAIALTVALAALVAPGAVVAEEPTVDTTADTTGPTEIQSGYTQTYNGSADAESNLTVEVDSENPKIRIQQQGRTIMSTTDPTLVDSDVSNSSYTYNVSVADDGSDFDRFEAGAGENVSLRVTVWNNTEATEPNKTAFNYTFHNGNEMVWVHVSEAEADDSDITTFDRSGGLFGIFSGINPFSSSDDEESPPTQVEQETTVAENTSEVELSFGNDTTQNSFEEAQADTSSGAFVPMSALAVEDRLVPVYAESADADYLDEDEDVYAELSSDGGTMSVNNAGELVDDREEVSMTATGNQAVGAQNTLDMLSEYDVSTAERAMLAGQAFAPFGAASEITIEAGG